MASLCAFGHIAGEFPSRLLSNSMIDSDMRGKVHLPKTVGAQLSNEAEVLVFKNWSV